MAYSLRMTTRQSTASDRRKHLRHEFRRTAKATIYPTGDCEDGKPKHRTVMTRDLSRSGIGFLHSKPLVPAQRVDLEFPDGRKYTVLVRRVHRMADGWYLIGCQFWKVTGRR